MDMNWDKTRVVGTEVSRWYVEAIDNGFMDKYLSGQTLLDFGSNGYTQGTTTFHENAIGVDTDYPNYNGQIFPFPDEHFDGILGSHVLEHIPTENLNTVIQELHRVLKTDSYLVLTLPHKFLYERKNELPSRNNGDHRRFYTPGSLLAEIETALVPNTYRVELCRDNDDGYGYSIPMDQHPAGAYEIILSIKKIKKQDWELL